MKKVLVMLAALLLVAGSAWALKPISNTQMASITGQAGVSIAVDDVKLYQHIEGIWYTDSDGLVATDPAANGLHVTSNAAGASVGIKDLEVMVNINAITSYDNSTGTWELHSIGRELQGNYGSLLDPTNDDNNQVFLAKPITIDVTSALPALSAGAAYNDLVANGGTASGNPTNFAGVMIGLGTIEIVQSNMKIDVAISDTDPLNGDTLTSVNGHDFGTLYLGKTTLAILDGQIEIAPH